MIIKKYPRISHNGIKGLNTHKAGLFMKLKKNLAGNFFWPTLHFLLGKKRSLGLEP